MGFRPNAWATVWSVEPSATGSSTKVRLSTSKKNKSGEYEQDFSGFCLFIGQAHTDAAKLAEKDRIKIGECEVTTSYDKEKGKEYINYKVYNFETSDGAGTQSNTKPKTKKAEKKTAFEDVIEEGENSEDDLPF
ncbi:MAG: hypothetical protein ACI4TK_12405 [Agathobacter sp.]